MNNAYNNENWGPYELRPNPTALLKLALGTSFAIATALVIPDAFAIAPTTLQGNLSDGAVIWLCRVVGLWAYAFMLWVVGFLALLHLLAIISGGIVIDSEGIKLWKFARKIPWSNVVACTVIERKFFSTLFCIRPCVMQMTLHIKKANSKRNGEPGEIKTTVKQIPSFQFLPAEFASLFAHISRHSFGVIPSSVDAFMFQPAEADTLRKMSDTGRIKRVVISTFIASSLLFVLGQRAACYYIYNTGNKYFTAQDYKKAITEYELSVKVYPAFAPGWDKLARCQYRTGNLHDAEEHWKKALFFKPDFVESKLGLSAVFMKQGRLDEAEPLIQKAVRLAPTDPAALINLAQINVYRGNIPEAIRLLEKLTRQDAGRNHIRCLLAQCFIRRGDFSTVHQILDKEKAVMERDPQHSSYYKLVCAELALEEGQVDKAAQFLEAVPFQKDNMQLVLDLANLRLAQKRVDDAIKMLDYTRSGSKNIPTAVWGSALVRAKAAWTSGDESTAVAAYRDAMAVPNSDSGVLARFAREFAKRGDNEKAIESAKKALAIDPENQIAAQVIKELGS